MISAAALIFGAALLAWSAPVALRPISARGEPGTAIVCWTASIFAVLAAVATGVGLLLAPGDHPASGVLGCWTAVRHGRLPELDEILGTAGLAAGLIVACRFVLVAVRRLRSARQAHRAHLDVLRILGGHTGPTTTLWLRHSKPLAYSVAGQPGLVVASTGLRGLPSEQIAAVLCHERAHLRGRHHLLVTLTRTLGEALPWVPLFRQAPEAIDLLVELAADAAAARSCGRPAVRAALLALDGTPAPESGLAMAHEAIPMRLARLTRQATPASATRRAATRAAVGLSLAALPALLGLGTVVLATSLSCTTG